MELNLVLPCEVLASDTLTVYMDGDGRGLAFKCVDTVGIGKANAAVAIVVLSDANIAKLALALHQWQCRNLD